MVADIAVHSVHYLLYMHTCINHKRQTAALVEVQYTLCFSDKLMRNALHFAVSLLVCNKGVIVTYIHSFCVQFHAACNCTYVHEYSVAHARGTDNMKCVATLLVELCTYSQS